MNHSQNQLLTLSELPESFSVPPIGNIPARNLFPIFSHYSGTGKTFVHADGSLFRLYEIMDFNVSTLDALIRNIPVNAALQIYKLKKNESVRIFCAITAYIDYGFMGVSFKDVYKSFLYGMQSREFKFRKSSADALSRLDKMVLPKMVHSSFTENELLSFLVDYSVTNQGMPFPSGAVKSNLSLILKGKTSVGCVSSVNNVDMIPNVTECLNDQEYLLTLTCVRPSSDQQKSIQKSATANKEMLLALAPKFPKGGPRADTLFFEDGKDFSAMPESENKGAYFFDASFFLSNSLSVDALRLQQSVFQNTLKEEGVLLYSHSNSARAQYTSLFPGNAVYGEHWNTAYSPFLFTFFRKMVTL